jgi:transposase
MMVVLTRTEHLQSVRERIEAAIADLLYLPPYSPDLNRIEKAWCKLKNTLSLIESQNSRSPRSNCRRTPPGNHPTECPSKIPT